MEKFIFAIDVGGTSIKGAIVTSNNNIILTKSLNTEITDDADYLPKIILNLISLLESTSNLKIENSLGLGIAIPGEIDSLSGTICVSNNLKIKNYNIIKFLKKFISVPIKIINDANAAALAEFKLGSAKKYKNFIVLTLGTGIGGDFYVDGKAYSSYSPFACEIGHIKIDTHKQIKCACGEYDCYEQYASTKALVKQTLDAMNKNKNSKMWQTYNEKTVNGRTVFEYLNIDSTAQDVFNNYIKYLGDGIVSLSNLLMPEAVIIGGSISNEGKILTEPLEKYVNSHIYAKEIKNCKIKIIPAKLSAYAGIIGAKLLINEE